MIKESLFIKSINNYKTFPLKRLPEILLIGRSNVGKSSLINALTNRKKISFVSKKAGKTMYLNYFLINNQFYLIDSPGYINNLDKKKNIINIFDIIGKFLKKNFFIKIIFQLMDFKIGPTLLDLKIYKKLNEKKILTIIIFNKKDKISKNKILNQIKKIEKIFLFNFFYIPKYLLISCKKKIGIKEIIDIIIQTKIISS
ncbi:ribosome biogenesis GTP-binding protein YihA/YsxC [Candidatus Phytoplasma oryzae]|nr:ribosome biogenesis GTP-binding protein YihA/YsxC [Candidatus Phytoplasma oryzae]